MCNVKTFIPESHTEMADKISDIMTLVGRNASYHYEYGLKEVGDYYKNIWKTLQTLHDALQSHKTPESCTENPHVPAWRRVTGATRGLTK